MVFRLRLCSMFSVVIHVFIVFLSLFLVGGQVFFDVLVWGVGLIWLVLLLA